MSRQYSLFASRVKTRRDKFASTRTSLSESWDQLAFCCEDDTQLPGFSDLPSPTIGGKGVHRFDSQLNIVSGDSVTPTSAGRFMRTFNRDTASSSLEPSPRSSADPAVPCNIWRKHVATQCNFAQTCHQHHHHHQVCRVCVDTKLTGHAHHHHHHHRPSQVLTSHPLVPGPMVALPFKKYRSKSFDWSHFPNNSYSALWEPFCDFLDTSYDPALYSATAGDGANGENAYMYAAGEQKDCTYCLNNPPPNIKLIDSSSISSADQVHGSNELTNKVFDHDNDNNSSVTCDKCMSLSEIKDEIESLTTNLVEQSESSLIGKSTTSGAPATDDAVQSPASPASPAVRPRRPTLSFTLPIPQVTVSTTVTAENQQIWKSNASSSSGTAASGPMSGRVIHQQSSSSTGSTTSCVSCGRTNSSTGRSFPTSGTASSGLVCLSNSSTSTIVNFNDIEHGREKSSTLPTIDTKHITAIRNAEKRRRFFARKQTNSAPDSFEASAFLHATHGVINTTRKLCGNCKEPVTNCLDGVLRATKREKTESITSATPTVEVWESEIRTARCGDVAVTHVSELDFPDADPPCHFCCEQASEAIHDESRLQIVSGGLVRSRDGSARSGSTPYINLPSPNVQADNGAPSVAFGSLDLSPSMSQTLSPGSHHNCHSHPSTSGSRASTHSSGGCVSGTSSSREKSEDEDPLVGPPASSLTRRPALVPPKIISDPDYENDSERDKCSSRNSDENTSPRTRRSSIVVIPPMQICPGDLLVYGKVLSQRKSLLGTTIESPSPVTSMFENESTPSRKQKASWSILKLFERSSRTKGTGTATLEDIMSIIQPCDFSDPKLSRFKGMPWSDFVAYVTQLKNKKKSDPAYPMDESAFLSKTNSVDISNPPPTADSTNESGAAALAQKIPPVVPTTAAELEAGVAKGLSKKEQAEAAAVATAKAKPLIRKRMGLMRTMSDRCLERRITPALWKASPGFLMGEKLVEGAEGESTGGDSNKPSTSSDAADAAGRSSSPSRMNKSTSKTASPLDAISSSLNSSIRGSSAASKAKPYPLFSAKSEKDFFTNIKECVQLRTIAAKTSTPAAVPEDSALDPDARQKLRQKEALWDLFQSECSFLYDHLMVLKNVFLEPLKRIQVEGFAMYAEPELLFGTLDELCCVTYGFCKEFVNLLLKLTDNFGELSTTDVLAKLFEPSSKARAMSQAYHRYALNYINALNYLETLRRHAEFGEFEKLCMKDPRCKKLQLTDLLVSPVQHIMKVPLILKDIQSRTDNPKEKELIAQILEIQENSIRELDDKMRWLKNFERLLEIQRNIIWPPILEMEPKTWVPDFLRAALSRQPCDSLVVSPRRQIIHEGLLQLWDTGKPSETYVILFDDMLLITRRKKGLSKKKSSLTENWASSCGKSGGVVGSGLETNHRYIVYRQPISLDRFFIHDIGEAENTTAKLDYAFVLVSLNRFQQIVAVHTFQGASEQIKSTWLLKMKTTQDKWKRTLQNTVFRGVRTSTDSGQSNVASSILGSLTKSIGKHDP